MSASSGSTLWPIVTVGGPGQPRVRQQQLDADLVIALPRRVIASGTVNGIPWTIEGHVTAAGPNAKWWEHGPIGPVLGFLLGTNGSFGGGEAETRIPEGTDFSCAVTFFGGFPEIVAWVGVASARTHHVEVQLDDGSVHRVELHEGPDGFPRSFWFFPPRGAKGAVRAVDVNGTELQSEALLERDVHPDAVAGTSVNPFAYAAGSPPPGWPDDRTEYGPGEGPRWDEDFSLHVAGSPILVLPPERWKGYAMSSGRGGSGERRVAQVRFAYLDAIPHPTHGLGVHSCHPDEAAERSSVRRVAREEEIGIWLPDPQVDEDVLDFLARWLPRDEVDRVYLSPVPDLGPRRYLGRVDLHGGRSAERWEYREYPELGLVGIPLPEVDVTMLGWRIPEEELLGYASDLERLELDSDLFRSMSRAEALSQAAFREVYEEGS